MHIFSSPVTVLISHCHARHCKQCPCCAHTLQHLHEGAEFGLQEQRLRIRSISFTGKGWNSLGELTLKGIPKQCAAQGCSLAVSVAYRRCVVTESCHSSRELASGKPSPLHHPQH